MPRKSSIQALDPALKSRIEALLGEGRLTLDQILGQIRTEFPDHKPPSRSALGRYKQSVDEIAQHMREANQVLDVWTQQFREVPHGDMGRTMLELLRLQAFHATQTLAGEAARGESVDVKALAALGRVAQQIEDAMRLNQDTRARLRAELAQEVETTLASAPRKLDAEALALVRRAIRGED